MQNICGKAIFSLSAVILPVVLLLNGCSSMQVLNEYDGAPRPDKEVAILDVSGFAGVASVDGKRLDKSCTWDTNNSGCQIRLMPGKHQFAVGYVGPNSTNSFNGVSVSGREVVPYLAVVSFDMKAGEKYKLFCMARAKSPQTHYMEVGFGVPGHKKIVKVEPDRYIKQK